VLSLLLCVLGLPHDWEGIYQILSCRLVLRVLSFEDLQTVHSEPSWRPWLCRFAGPAAKVMTVRVAVTQKLRERIPSIAAVQLVN